MNRTLPRGYRNNNPGNVDRGKDRWLGMAEDQSGDSRFIVFASPEYGIRCIMRLLITYYETHGLTTIRGIVNRWAPPNGKHPITGQPYTQNTDGYVNHVASLTGWHPDETLDLFDMNTNMLMTKAIVRHELGNPTPYGKPEFWYGDDTYNKALALAGFAVGAPPVKKSRTIAGSAVAIGGAVAGALHDSLGDTVTAATQATSAMSFLPEGTVKFIFLAIILLGAGTAIGARISDSKKRVV